MTAEEAGRESEEMLSDMVALQKEVLSSLGLHYRYVDGVCVCVCVCVHACVCMCVCVHVHMYPKGGYN